jgi:hypothetical protein
MGQKGAEKRVFEVVLVSFMAYLSELRYCFIALKWVCICLFVGTGGGCFLIRLLFVFILARITYIEIILILYMQFGVYELWAIKKITMTWDGDKTNDYFIKLHTRQNPERYKKYEVFEDSRDIELALQDLYSICAQNAWTEKRLLKALENIIISPTISKEAKNSEKYLATKTEEALKLKNAILDKSFSIYNDN